MTSPSDRRHAPRRLAHIVAEIDVDGSIGGLQRFTRRQRDGLLLLSRIELPAGKRVCLRLLVPNEASPRTLEAVVVRCQKTALDQRDLWLHQIAVSICRPTKRHGDDHRSALQKKQTGLQSLSP